MAEFTARNAGGQTVVADGNLLVYQTVGKCIGALGHGTNEDANAFFRAEGVDVVPNMHEGGLEAECDLAAVWR